MRPAKPVVAKRFSSGDEIGAITIVVAQIAEFIITRRGIKACRDRGYVTLLQDFYISPMRCNAKPSRIPMASSAHHDRWIREEAADGRDRF